ncbi:PstA family ABC transporter permease [Aporhodopirellula aestuarii]|uniref:Phosphate ABC transporter permease PstA n=1 Tax=Aporhodopirellula aestuarii TaxID=2950107 RepID=A0ABT0U4U8_9BACT|nr:PstA family ABC transporter permease [Aporhodopirellula aestuarii]MCM2371959.1 phosphate ABC transporter permease PstA [Aporhodopirellula aestuarii]
MSIDSISQDAPQDPGVQRPIPEAIRQGASATAESTLNSRHRKRVSKAFYGLCVAISLLSVLVLVVLLISIAVQGHSRLTPTLLTGSHSTSEPASSGMYPAIIGSLAICFVCALSALPLGIGTAIFLEEFQPTNIWLRRLHGFINLNISNLAGVPSIVYGLLGLSLFVFMFNAFGQIKVNESSGTEIMGVERYYQVLTLAGGGDSVLIPQSDLSQPTITITEPMPAVDRQGNTFQLEVWDPKSETPKPSDPAIRHRTVRLGQGGGAYAKTSWYYFRLPFGRSFLAAGLTLSLVILPIVIIASQESLRSVSPSLREASYGLGATKWQTVRNVSLPAAIPGIMTGAILAMGRAIGEAAPILVVLGATVAKNSGPQNLMDTVVTMPVLIFHWAGDPQFTYQQLAAAAIIVLLLILLLMNSVAIYLRQKMRIE